MFNTVPWAKLEEEEVVRRPEQSFPDLHLDSPLNPYVHDTIIRKFDAPDTKVVRRELEDWSKVQHQYRGMLQVESYITKLCFSWLHGLYGIEAETEVASSHLKRMFNIIMPSSQNLRFKPVEEVIAEATNLFWHYLNADLSIRRFVLDTACLTIGLPTSQNAITGEDGERYLEWTYCGLRIKAYKHLYTFENRGLVYCGTRNHMLMLSTLISDRFRTLFFLLVSNNGMLDRKLPSSHLIETMYKFGDDVLRQVGRNGYKVIKSFEPLTLGGLLLKVNDPELNDPCLYTLAKTEILEILGKRTNLVDQFNVLIRRIIDESESDCSIWTECFGLYRHWGHPEVHGLDGLKAIKKVGQKWTFPDQNILEEAHAIFVEILFSNYLHNEGRYPPCSTERLPIRSEVRRAIEENDDVRKEHSNYNVLDWGKVKVAKTFSIPSGSNLLSTLGDKAHGAKLPDLIQATNKGLQPSPWSRRVLLSWLKEAQPELEQLLTKVASGNLDPSDQVMGILEKERELKLDPRNFGLLPFQVRQWVVVTEALLAIYILPLFPYTSMISSAVELDHTLHSMSAGHGDSQSTLKVTMNIDFEKWNNHMRESITSRWFLTLDDLFGIEGLFSYTHKFFNSVPIYLADNSVKLPNKDGKLTYGPGVMFHHLGGIEGLRQKGWTVVTSSLIQYVSRKFNFKTEVIGQGDNQVITVEFPLFSDGRNASARSQEIKKMMSRFREFQKELFKTFSLVRLPIKAEETWTSNKVMTYGKRTYVEGVESPMSLKKICKACPMVNQTFPSLHQGFTSLNGTASAAASNRVHPDAVFQQTKYEEARWLCELMDWHPLLGVGLRKMLHQTRKHEYRDGQSYKALTLDSFLINDLQAHGCDFLVKHLINFPLILGGLPITTFEDLVTRGFPDPLSRDLVYLKRLEGATGLSKDLVKAMSNPVMLQCPDPLLLFEDPVAIPVVGAPNVKNIMKQKVLSWLRSSEKVNNPQFKELLRIRDKDLGQLVKWLWNESPCNPRLFGDILASTMPGCVNTLLSRFDNTKTLGQLTLQQGTFKVRKTISKLEVRSITGAIAQLSHMGKYETAKCPSAHARNLRRVGWARDDIIGVSTPFPSAFIAGFDTNSQVCGQCREHENNHDPKGFVSLSYCICQLTAELLRTRGPGILYLGSATAEKVPSTGAYKASDVDSLIHRIFKLPEVIGWFVRRNSSLARLIICILQTVTDADPDMFTNCGVAITGAVEHRYHDRVSPTGGFINYLVNPGSYCHISTNLFEKYCKGGKNYNVHFQSLMCYLQYLGIRSLCTRFCPIQQHFHEVCDECTILLDSDMTSKENELPLPSLEKGSAELNLWIPKESLIKAFTVRDRYVDAPRIHSFTYEDAICVIADSIYKSHSSLQLTGKVSQLLPIPWILKTRAKHILERVAINMIIKSTISWTYYSRKRKIYLDSESFKHGMLMKTLFTPSEIWYPLTVFFSLPETRESLLIDFPDVDFPNCAPYRSTTCQGYFHRCVIKIMRELLSNHEYCKAVVSRWLKNSSITLLETEMLTFGELFDIVTAVKLIPSILLRDTAIQIHPQMTLLRDKFHQLISCSTSAARDYLIWISKPSSYYVRLLSGTRDGVVKECDRDTEVDLSVCCPKVMSSGNEHLGTTVTVVEEFSPRDLTSDQADEVPENPTRHMLPPRCHFFKVLNSLTTAWYKYNDLFEFLIALGWRPRPGSAALSLADGSGGVCALIYRKWSDVKVGYASLLNESGCLEHSKPGFFPPALGQLCPESLHDLVKRMVNGPDDITHDEFVKETEKAIVESIGKCDISLITCDAELPGGVRVPTTGKMIDSLYSLMKRSVNPCIVVQKIFASSPQFLQYVISRWLLKSCQIQLVRSKFSSTGSTECFLICRLTTETVEPGYLPMCRAETIFNQVKEAAADLPPSKLAKTYTKWMLGVSNIKHVESSCTGTLLNLGVICKPGWNLSSIRVALHTSIERIITAPFLSKATNIKLRRAHIFGKAHANRVWSILHALRPRRNQLTGVDLIPDPPKVGNLLVYISQNGTLCCWNFKLPKGMQYKTFKSQHNGLVYKILALGDRLNVLKVGYQLAGQIDFLGKCNPSSLPSEPCTLLQAITLLNVKTELISPSDSRLRHVLSSNRCLYL
nr:MAG: RNA-dependent RNA polymerase [Wufeng shrew rhabdovirus 10]